MKCDYLDCNNEDAIEMKIDFARLPNTNEGFTRHYCHDHYMAMQQVRNNVKNGPDYSNNKHE